MQDPVQYGKIVLQMSLETVFANPPPLVGADTNETGKDKERYAECDTQPIDDDHSLPYGRSSSWNTEHSQGREEDLEDGELEDGEIDDPVEIVPPPIVHAPPPVKFERKEEKRPHHDRESPRKSPSDEDSDEDDKSRKRKKKKKKKDRKKEDKDKDKKKKKRKYVDHDRVSEDQFPAIFSEAPSGGGSGGIGWSGFGSGRSPPGPYDSPPYEGGSSDRRAPPSYADLDGPGYHKSHSAGSPRQGSYRSGYKSPPGPYDSPSEDEEFGPPPKLQRGNDPCVPEFSRFDSMESSGSSRQQSLISMAGDNFMDPNVAASEQEDVFNRGQKNYKKKKSDKYFKEHRQREHNKKRSLHDTPMNERPQCKFHMEGKCQKGDDCPFNHDFEPPLRFELCKFYMSNQCSRGTGCLYMHDDYPCKFYHLDGNCQYEDHCRFSHAKLSPELFTLFKQQVIQRDQNEEQFNDNNTTYEEGNKKDVYQANRDSYYGAGTNEDYGGSNESPHHNRSPPQQNNSNTQQNNSNSKKIPSIFDIEVFPPGKGPRQQGPSNQGGPPPLGMQGPRGMQSPQGPRPNFFPDMSGPPPGNNGPPSNGPQTGGPPPRGPPPNQPGLLGPPPMRFRGMRPPGPGGPNGPGPMGPGGLMGPGGPMGPGPMRHPGSRPMGPGQMGPPGPMMGPGSGPMIPQGHGGPGPGGPAAPGYFNNGQFFGGPPSDIPFDPNQQNDNFVNSRGDTDMRQQPNNSDGSMNGDNPNMTELDINPEDIPRHLAPKQKELFMRIQQQQRDNVSDATMKEDLENAIKNENWYSSDEDESSTHKEGNAISNLWTSLTQPNADVKQGPGGHQGKQDGQQGQMPNFDIAQMLSAIRTMTGVPNPPGGAKGKMNAARDPRQSDPRQSDPRQSDPRQSDPRQSDLRQSDPRQSDLRQSDPRQSDPRQSDPRQSDLRQSDPRQSDPRQSDPRSKSDPRLARMSSDPRLAQQASSPTVAQTSSPQRSISEDLPEIDGSIATQTKTGRRVLYILHTCEATIVPGKIPSHIDIHDEKYKDDPRILKALNKLDPRKGKFGNKVPSSPLGALGKSATMGPPGSSPKVDPRIQRTLSAPTGTGLPAPSMPDALKERPLLNRRPSSDAHVVSPTGELSPRTKESNKSSAYRSGELSPRTKEANKALAYRSDPRYRKKKMSGDQLPEPTKPSSVSDNSPVHDNSKDNSKDTDSENQPVSSRRGMDYASPLGGRDDKSSSSGFGFYNQAPNDKFLQLQEPKRGHKKDSDMRNSPDSSLIPLLPEHMQQPPGLAKAPSSTSLGTGIDLQIETDANGMGSMRDVFKTLDPTASPFC